MKHHLLKSRDVLTIEEKVEAALQLQRHLDPIVRLSVCEVCRRTGVNRSNLYANHPRLVESILGHAVGAGARNPLTKKNVIAEQPNPGASRVSDREKALLYICLELRTELQHVLALQQLGKKSDRRKV